MDRDLSVCIMSTKIQCRELNKCRQKVISSRKVEKKCVPIILFYGKFNTIFTLFENNNHDSTMVSIYNALFLLIYNYF